MSPRVRTLLEHHFALEKAFPVKVRRAQDIVREVANRAGITRDVSPHILRHTFATTSCLARRPTMPQATRRWISEQVKPIQAINAQALEKVKLG